LEVEVISSKSDALWPFRRTAWLQRVILPGSIPFAERVSKFFLAPEIGVGHALLLAKLPADQQEQALSACFKEVYNRAAKPARIDVDRPRNLSKAVLVD
jgi:hypothetical protein